MKPVYQTVKVMYQNDVQLHTDLDYLERNGIVIQWDQETNEWMWYDCERRLSNIKNFTNLNECVNDACVHVMFGS
jgi:hypothetical protein